MWPCRGALERLSGWQAAGWWMPHCLRRFWDLATTLLLTGPKKLAPLMQIVTVLLTSRHTEAAPGQHEGLCGSVSGQRASACPLGGHSASDNIPKGKTMSGQQHMKQSCP